VSPVKYELGVYIPEDSILHSHRRENLKSYKYGTGLNDSCTLLSAFIKTVDTSGPNTNSKLRHATVTVVFLCYSDVRPR
jgi:hypothetical protein